MANAVGAPSGGVGNAPPVIPMPTTLRWNAHELGLEVTLTLTFTPLPTTLSLPQAEADSTRQAHQRENLNSLSPSPTASLSFDKENRQAQTDKALQNHGKAKNMPPPQMPTSSSASHDSPRSSKKRKIGERNAPNASQTAHEKELAEVGDRRFYDPDQSMDKRRAAGKDFGDLPNERQNLKAREKASSSTNGEKPRAILQSSSFNKDKPMPIRAMSSKGKTSPTKKTPRNEGIENTNGTELVEERLEKLKGRDPFAEKLKMIVDTPSPQTAPQALRTRVIDTLIAGAENSTTSSIYSLRPSPSIQAASPAKSKKGRGRPKGSVNKRKA